MQLETLFVTDLAPSSECDEVRRVAFDLRTALDQEPARSLLITANQPKASSHAVQNAILPAATALGFRSEVRGLFQGAVGGLRPDFYRPVGDSGILLEVERGKTTTNNMDLLDFWKVHICERAHYLFLFVPLELRHNQTKPLKREFRSVRKRLGQFFEPRNRTNVRGLCLFGY